MIVTVDTSGGKYINFDLIQVTVDYTPDGTTIGDGSSPSDKSVAPTATNNAVDAFTLFIRVGTDTLTDLTVTFAGNEVNDVATNGVKIYRDDGASTNDWEGSDTLIAIGSFSGNTATFAGLNVGISTTSTQYLVTYDIAAAPGYGDTLQGAVTAATVVTNNPPNLNDRVDATLTLTAYCRVTINTDGGGRLPA